LVYIVLILYQQVWGIVYRVNGIPEPPE